MIQDLHIQVNLETNEVRIDGGSMSPWNDLGILLEGVGLLMAVIRTQHMKTDDELIAYVKSYIDKMKGDFPEAKTNIPSPFNP